MLAMVSHNLGADGSYGPFSPWLLHYPLGLLVVAVMLEAWNHWRPDPGTRRAVGFLLGWSALAAWLALASGWLRSFDGDFEPLTVSLHKVFAAAVALLSTLCWWLHEEIHARRRRWGTTSMRSVLALAVTGAFFVGTQTSLRTGTSQWLTERSVPASAAIVGQLEAAPALEWNVAPEDLRAPDSPPAEASRADAEPAPEMADWRE